jgi:flagellar basal-body rod protein FlgG
MAAQQAWLDSLANDVANVQTEGYKQSRIGFRDLVNDAGAAAVDAGRSFREGTLVETEDPLAVAIEGPGFFAVKRGDGQTALTRAGDFQLDARGAIVTASGMELQPPVTLPKGASANDVAIDSDGTIRVGTTKVGALTVVQVPVPEGLASGGDTTFLPTAASGAPAPLKGAVVKQGVLESSNVDIASAMTDLVQAQRGYELQSRVLRMQDELMEIANGIRR